MCIRCICQNAPQTSKRRNTAAYDPSHGTYKSPLPAPALAAQGIQSVPHLVHHCLCIFLVLLFLRHRLLRLGHRSGGHRRLLSAEDFPQDLFNFALGLLVLSQQINVLGQRLVDHLFDDAGLHQLDAELAHGAGQLGQPDEVVDVLHDADAGADRALNLADGKGLVDLHLHRVELRLGRDEPRRRLARADELARKVPDLLLRLFGPRGVPLGALVRREDEVLGLDLDLLDLGDVAIEFPDIGPDHGVAFSGLVGEVEDRVNGKF